MKKFLVKQKETDCAFKPVYIIRLVAILAKLAMVIVCSGFLMTTANLL